MLVHIEQSNHATIVNKITRTSRIEILEMAELLFRVQVSDQSDRSLFKSNVQENIQIHHPKSQFHERDLHAFISRFGEHRKMKVLYHVPGFERVSVCVGE